MTACELQMAKRRALAELAVVEAARAFMAVHLSDERSHKTWRPWEVDEALQGLRDALVVHSKVRVR